MPGLCRPTIGIIVDRWDGERLVDTGTQAVEAKLEIEWRCLCNRTLRRREIVC